MAWRAAPPSGPGVAPAGEVDRIVGIESRGFLFGMAVAHAIGAGFVPVRKPGKLPAATVHQTYALEYGQDRLHMHAEPGAPDATMAETTIGPAGGTVSVGAARVVVPPGALAMPVAIAVATMHV